MPDSALKRLANMSNPGNWLIASLEGAQAYNGPGRTDPGWFHPSSLGEECDANLAFRFLGAPGIEVIQPRLRRIFDNGSGRDLWLKQDAHKAGISLINEYNEPYICSKCGLKNLKDDRHICIPLYHIRGDLDEWVKNPVTHRKYIVDFKTMRSDLFKALEAVKPDHHLQVHPYMFAKETYEGYVLYENKDSQELKCMPSNFENNKWQINIVQRIERILEGLELDVVYRNPTSCSQCPFFANGICTNNDIARLKEESGLWSR